MIGRDRELTVAELALDKAASGMIALVVEGEAGIGKTTLWQKVVGAAHSRGFGVLACRPTMPERGLSFSVIGDLLADVEAATLEALPAPQRHALQVALLQAEPAGPADDWRATGVGLASVLRQLTESGPLVVAIDDVQWVDQASGNVIEFALRRLSNEPVALVLAARVPDQTGIPFALDRSLPSGRLSTLRLDPLSLGAIYRVVTAQLGRRLQRSTLVRIHQASGGNPFHALALARSLDTDGPTHPGAALPLPPTLADTVRRRLETLPDHTRRTLLAVALAAHPTRQLVGAVAGESAERALQDALEEGLVEIRGDDVRLSHPLLGSGIVAVATEIETRDVHARLAELVPELEGRARHAAIAAGGVPDESTVRDLLRAAELARARGAAHSAAELAVLAAGLTPADAEARVERELLAAEYVFLSGDAVGAEEALGKLAERLEHGAVRARTKILAARVAWETQGSLEACRLCEEAIAEAADDPVLAGEAHTWAAEFSDFDEAARSRHAQAAVAVLESVAPTDEPRLAAALKAYAESELVLGRGIPRCAVERAIALQATHRPNRVSDRVEVALGWWLVWTDELAEARRRLEAGYRTAIDEGDESSLPQVTGWLRELELRAGNLGRAHDYAQEQLDAAEEQGEPLWVAVARGRRSLVEAHLGLTEGSRADAEAALAVAEACRDPGLALLCEWALGFLALSRDELAEAASWLGRADATHEGIGLVEPGYARFQADLVEALVGLGRLDEAEIHLCRYEQRARATDRPSALAGAARSRALLHGARGEGEEALEALEEARRALDRVEMPFERARMLLVAGMVMRRLRRRGEARKALEEARAGVRRARRGHVAAAGGGGAGSRWSSSPRERRADGHRVAGGRARGGGAPEPGDRGARVPDAEERRGRALPGLPQAGHPLAGRARRLGGVPPRWRPGWVTGKTRFQRPHSAPTLGESGLQRPALGKGIARW